MQQLITSRANTTKDIITRLVYKTEVIASYIKMNNGEIKDFEVLANAIIDDENIVNFILAPQGKVAYTYSLTGNVPRTGFDYFAETTPGRNETIYAKENRTAILAGPLEAQQGGVILSGRLPLYLAKQEGKDEYFWGFVFVSIKYPEVLYEAGFNELDKQGYHYVIWHYNPDLLEREIILQSPDTGQKRQRYIDEELSILNADWHFQISPIKAWYEYHETWVLIFFALLLSFLITLIIQNNRRMRMLERDISDETAYTDILFNSSPLVCFLWDKDITIHHCNEETFKLFGLNKQQDIRKIFFKLSPEIQPDGVSSNIAAAQEIQKAFDTGYAHREWMHQTIQGEPIPCDIVLNRVQYKDKKFVAVYVRDLRELKAFLAEIDQARNEAIAASSAKSTFLSNMSHEIRTPLNCIIGFAELARDDKISSKTYDYLTNIIDSSGMLLDIINDILDISKIEAGKMELEHIHFDLSEVILQCQKIITPKIMDKNVTLYCYAEPNIDKKLLGDPVRLRQIIINLLSNAVKFTKTGAIKLLTSVVHTDEHSITIHFEVKDSGIGMTEEQLKKIFEPFSQADESISRQYGGTGLGLAIIKNLIELMHGTLNVESFPNIGSRFYFDLTFDAISIPLGEVEDNSKNSEIEQPWFQGTVLVFEDNLLNQQVIKEYLAKVGLDVVIANDGQEGVEIVAEYMKHQKKLFDLIFMDMHMPKMDGMVATAHLIQMGFPNPIVALTANILSNDVALYKKNGMAGYLGKPFTKQKLWKCLTTFLIPVKMINESKDSPEDYNSLQQKLCINFYQSNQHLIADIKEAILNEDIKLAHRLVHTLKSNAGQIGEKKVSEIAELVENQLRNGINRLSNEQLLLLEVTLHQALEKLAPLLSLKRTKFIGKNSNPEALQEILTKCENLVQNNDTECLDTIDTLLTFEGTEKLVEAIDNLNFKEALVEISLLKNK